eukprot:g1302.t1
MEDFTRKTIPGAKKDFQRLFNRFRDNAGSELALKDFASAWTEMHFSNIHRSLTEEKKTSWSTKVSSERTDFTQELFATVLSFAKPTAPKKDYVAIVFTLYALYYSQPTKEKVPIRLSVTSVVTEMWIRRILGKDDSSSSSSPCRGAKQAIKMLDMMMHGGIFLMSAYVGAPVVHNVPREMKYSAAIRGKNSRIVMGVAYVLEQYDMCGAVREAAKVYDIAMGRNALDRSSWSNRCSPSAVALDGWAAAIVSKERSVLMESQQQRNANRRAAVLRQRGAIDLPIEEDETLPAPLRRHFLAQRRGPVPVRSAREKDSSSDGSSSSSSSSDDGGDFDFGAIVSALPKKPPLQDEEDEEEAALKAEIARLKGIAGDTEEEDEEEIALRTEIARLKDLSASSDIAEHSTSSSRKRRSATSKRTTSAKRVRKRKSATSRQFLAQRKGSVSVRSAHEKDSSSDGSSSSSDDGGDSIVSVLPKKPPLQDEEDEEEAALKAEIARLKGIAGDTEEEDEEEIALRTEIARLKDLSASSDIAEHSTSSSRKRRSATSTKRTTSAKRVRQRKSATSKSDSKKTTKKKKKRARKPKTALVAGVAAINDDEDEEDAMLRKEIEDRVRMLSAETAKPPPANKVVEKEHGEEEEEEDDDDESPPCSFGRYRRQ